MLVRPNYQKAPEMSYFAGSHVPSSHNSLGGNFVSFSSSASSEMHPMPLSGRPFASCRQAPAPPCISLSSGIISYSWGWEGLHHTDHCSQNTCSPALWGHPWWASGDYLWCWGLNPRVQGKCPTVLTLQPRHFLACV